MVNRQLEKPWTTNAAERQASIMTWKSKTPL